VRLCESDRRRIPALTLLESALTYAAWLWCKHESELDGSDLGANLHLCSKHGIPDCGRSLASAP
jgi:hypothetical protein